MEIVVEIDNCRYDVELPVVGCKLYALVSDRKGGAVDIFKIVPNGDAIPVSNDKNVINLSDGINFFTRSVRG